MLLYNKHNRHFTQIYILFPGKYLILHVIFQYAVGTLYYSVVSVILCRTVVYLISVIIIQNTKFT